MSESIEVRVDDATYRRLRRAIKEGTPDAALRAYDARAEAKRLAKPEAPTCPKCGGLSEGTRLRIIGKAQRVHFCANRHEWDAAPKTAG